MSVVTVYASKSAVPRMLQNGDAKKIKGRFLWLYFIFFAAAAVLLGVMVLLWGRDFAFVASLACGVILVQSVIVIMTLHDLIFKKKTD